MSSPRKVRMYVTEAVAEILEDFPAGRVSTRPACRSTMIRSVPLTESTMTGRSIYKVYNGWWFVGRPTSEEIRMDLRALMLRRPDWVYSGRLPTPQ